MISGVKGDGTVWSFGDNFHGQLGDGTTASLRETPVPVVGVSGATAIAAGESHALALKADGTVVAWGFNAFGQLGDGTSSSRNTPAAVSGLSNIVAIAAGTRHSLALSATGMVYAWGDNAQFQLGDGTSNDRLLPGAVSGLPVMTAIASGGTHAVALTGDGHVWTWGHSVYGQLGRSTALTLPGEAPGVAGIVAVAAGRDQTFAFASDGGVWGWGRNESGELGDGSTANRAAPSVLAEAGGAWRVAMPRFSVSPGTYETEQTVLITSATPGATVHYTDTGADPTESDPVPPGAGVVVSQSRMLKARAWKSGMPPSATSTAAYTLQVSTPTISPSSATFSAPQTVTMTESDTQAVVRLTLDGSDPTETSPIYGGPFALSTATTVKARAFRSGWTPSEPASRKLHVQLRHADDADGLARRRHLSERSSRVAQRAGRRDHPLHARRRHAERVLADLRRTHHRERHGDAKGAIVPERTGPPAARSSRVMASRLRRPASRHRGAVTRRARPSALPRRRRRDGALHAERRHADRDRSRPRAGRDADPGEPHDQGARVSHGLHDQRSGDAELHRQRRSDRHADCRRGEPHGQCPQRWHGVGGGRERLEPARERRHNDPGDARDGERADRDPRGERRRQSHAGAGARRSRVGVGPGHVRAARRRRHGRIAHAPGAGARPVVGAWRWPRARGTTSR